MGSTNNLAIHNRRFEAAKRVEVNFISIRGTGITGKWHLEAVSKDGDSLSGGHFRYLIEFLPKRFRFTRLGLMGEGERQVSAPAEIKSAFDAFVRTKCQERGLPMRRTRQGPGYLMDQLANLLVFQELEPGDAILNEIELYIRWHFENPDYIRNVVANPKQFHFGDDETGLFVLTETPPRFE